MSRCRISWYCTMRSWMSPIGCTYRRISPGSVGSAWRRQGTSSWCIYGRRMSSTRRRLGGLPITRMMYCGRFRISEASNIMSSPTKTITYADLERVLTQIGFVAERPRGAYQLFRYPTPEVLIVLPPAQAGDTVDAAHVVA